MSYSYRQPGGFHFKAELQRKIEELEIGNLRRKEKRKKGNKTGEKGGKTEEKERKEEKDKP